MRKEQNKNGRVHDSEAVVLSPKLKEVRSLIESLRLRVQLLDLKAVVLGGTYILFHAVIYGLQANPSSASPPENPWVLASLLATVSLAFWPAFIDTVDNCMRTRRQQESSFIEREKVYRKKSSQQHTRRDDSAAAAQSLALGFASVRRRRHAYVGTLYFALLLYTLSVSYVLLSLPNKPRHHRSTTLSKFHLCFSFITTSFAVLCYADRRREKGELYAEFERRIGLGVWYASLSSLAFGGDLRLIYGEILILKNRRDPIKVHWFPSPPG